LNAHLKEDIGMLDGNRIYHTGFAVADLEASQRMLTDALGIEWAPVHRYDPLHLWLPGKGWIEVRMRAVYSRPGPHQFELIQGDAPGGFFDPALIADPRHMGLWTDELHEDVKQLLRLGWKVVAAKGSPDEGYGTMAYMKPPLPGPMLELVSTELRPMLLAWFDEPHA
jgi:catechol 2,3-dioxygenase-like lactoylglutathione lyase family enzyme